MSGDLATRLRFAVKRIGTQKEAAADIGVSPTQVKRYLQGRSHPSLKAFERISAKSGLSLTWLLMGEGAPDTSHAQGKALANESMVRILEKRVAELEAQLAARKTEPDSAYDSYRKLAEQVHARLARIAELVPTDTTNVGWGEVGTLTEVDSQLRNIVGFLEGITDGR